MSRHSGGRRHRVGGKRPGYLFDYQKKSLRDVRDKCRQCDEIVTFDSDRHGQVFALSADGSRHHCSGNMGGVSP